MRERASPSPAAGGSSESTADRGGGSDAPGTHGPVTHWKGFELSPFQREAVEAVQRGDNVLVSAPTGAGKTLVAEYAIEDAVRRGRRCVYTAPIKALSNQKFRDFRDEPEVDVGILTGDVTLHPHAQVLIMTTEILRNAIFEDPDSLHDVEYVVFDEVHFLDDAERGSVWEEALIFAPPSIRFICLSATVSNVDELGAWLEEIRPHPLTVIRSERRPVDLSYRLWVPGAGLLAPRQLGGERARATRERRARRGRGRDRRKGGPPRRGPRERTPGPPDERALVDELVRRDLLPALVFSFSRRDCERLAHRNGGRELLSDAERERMAALQRELVASYRLDEAELEGELLRLAARGIGYHHAGMLPIHKELVERMFTSGLLRLLFTTETFALGINMPARTVVFQGLKKFDGVQFDYLRRRDFLQMAGRAGRLGIDTQGHVVLLLGERDLVEAPVDRLLAGQPEPILSRFGLTYSTLLHLVDHLGRGGALEAWEKSFNRFQHRERSRKARERNQREQEAAVGVHLRLLDELGYLEEGHVLTPRGRLAQTLYGYELQITELVFRGTLEDLPPDALVMIFVALIHEERRRGPEPYVPSRMYGGLRRHVRGIVDELAVREARAGVPTPLKRPEWGLTPAVLAWMEGAQFDELEDLVDAPAGDLCRTFRMGLQLLRQLRRAIDPEWPLHAILGDAMRGLDRDEVDARRQLELG